MKTLQLRNNPAYNEGNLLGHQVTNGVFGAVPLTFTRNSNGYILDTNGAKLRGANVPRIKSDGSVLLEPARTNLLRYSEQFDNAAWVKTSGGTGSAPVVTANAITAPDGTITADRVVFNLNGGTTSSDQSLISQLFLGTSGVVYTHTIYVKSDNGGESLAIRGADSSSYTKINITNQWQRITLTSTSNATGARYFEFGLRNVGSATGLNDSATIYLWGAQLEVGSYPTSYIPTTSATITRVAESVSKTGIANLIGQSEGTIFFEGSVVIDSTQCAITLSDGSTTNQVALSYRLSTSKWECTINAGGVSQVSLAQTGTTPISTTHKIAIRYKANDFALYINGVKVGEDLSLSTFNGALNQMRFSSPTGTIPFYGEVKQLALYTTALTDDELYNLTK